MLTPKEKAQAVLALKQSSGWQEIDADLKQMEKAATSAILSVDPKKNEVRFTEYDLIRVKLECVKAFRSAPDDFVAIMMMQLQESIV